jgi:HEAT repeat protein
MPDLAFASVSSTAVSAAIWTTIASLAASLLLLLYTLELRWRRRQRERRRARAVAHWRSIIADAVTGAESVAPIPALPHALPRAERAEFLKLWNLTRNMVEGAAAERLIALAGQLGVPELARREARQKRPVVRLMGIRTLGHLRDRTSFALVQSAIDDHNPLISITAAEALIEIDPARAIDVLIPQIARRRDWPRTHVFRMLQKAGSALVGEPLYRAIRTAGDSDAAYLLKFLELAEFDVRDAICAELLSSRQDPELIAAALKAASGYSRMPRLDELVRHSAWYIRMQAARFIGRLGRAEDVGRLEELLGDREWWVRYRAARALVQLPMLARAELEQIRDRQNDPYARDILGQAIVEAGLRQ